MRDNSSRSVISQEYKGGGVPPVLTERPQLACQGGFTSPANNLRATMPQVLAHIFAFCPISQPRRPARQCIALPGFALSFRHPPLERKDPIWLCGNNNLLMVHPPPGRSH